MNNLRIYFDEEEFIQLKKCDSMESKCLTIALRLFSNIYDKSGNPYVGHLMRVSNGVKSNNAICAALLHDVIEDINDITTDDLLDVGISEEIVNIIKLVTRNKVDSYDAEIERIINSGNVDAIDLKDNTMNDNSDPKRLEKLDIATKIKLKSKYIPNLKRLKKARKDYD